MKEWVRMPSYWLRNEDHYPLPDMKWVGEKKADQIAALMIYIVLVHHANGEVTTDKQELGLCSLTYTKLSDITGLSRAKISGGLKVLTHIKVITQTGTGRNNLYKIENYGSPGGWGKLPARGLYNNGYEKIPAFHRFQLRSKNELNAMKIYLLFVALRSNSTNYAKVGYDKISEYTGMHRNEIKSAISFLINLGLVQVDTGNSDINEFAKVNMYRLCYLEPYKHRGTSARDLEAISN
ncbi:MAG TPA: hypothetical protein ENJ13_07790 [Chromatiales bacterium]|nr:hypothetical protein [Chromatiales bacterium]